MVFCIEGPRPGYKALSYRLNHAAKRCRGDYILFVDEAVVVSPSWDVEFRKLSVPKISIIYLKQNCWSPGWCHPMLTREVYEAMGHFSLGINDAYLKNIASGAGIALHLKDKELFLRDPRGDELKDLIQLKGQRTPWGHATPTERQNVTRITGHYDARAPSLAGARADVDSAFINKSQTFMIELLRNMRKSTVPPSIASVRSQPALSVRSQPAPSVRSQPAPSVACNLQWIFLVLLMCSLILFGTFVLFGRRV